MDLALPASVAVQLDERESAKEQERKPEQGFGEGRRQIDYGNISTQVPESEVQVVVR